LNPIAKEKTHNIFYQILRFQITAGIVLLINTSILFVLTEYAQIHYLVSDAIGFMIGLMFNYYLCVNWVFANRNIKSKSLEFFLFLLIGLGALALNEFSMWFITEQCHVFYIISKLITLVFLFFYSFFGRKFLLFK